MIRADRRAGFALDQIVSITVAFSPPAAKLGP
jgi:hypothetical protein